MAVDVVAGRRETAAVLAVSVGAAYAWVAAGTRPFTAGADLVTAVAFAALALFLVRSLQRRHHVAEPRDAAPPSAGSLRPWVVALCVLGAWELATYLAGVVGARHDFPTLSSLSDIAFRWRAAKAACFAAWLALGWGLVRR